MRFKREDGLYNAEKFCAPCTPFKCDNCLPPDDKGKCRPKNGVKNSKNYIDCLPIPACKTGEWKNLKGNINDDGSMLCEK